MLFGEEALEELELHKEWLQVTKEGNVERFEQIFTEFQGKSLGFVHADEEEF